jgi:hypothetical protein
MWEQTLKSKWMGGLVARAREVEWNFSSITVAQRMVKKWGGEGSHLYPKRLSEGPWIDAKCSFERESENLYGGGALLRFRVLDQWHGGRGDKREWGEWLRGAHLSWEGPTTHPKAQTNGQGGEKAWAGRRGAWAWEKGVPHKQRAGAWAMGEVKG